MFGNLGAKAKAAAEYSSQALQSAATLLPTAETCTACGKIVSAARNLTGIGTLLPCVCCGERFCKKCIRKSVEPVPEYLRSSKEGVPSSDENSVPGMGMICKVRCYPECVNYWMTAMTSKYEKITCEIVQQHLANQFSDLILFPKPAAILDSKSRKAKRLLYLAEYAAEVVGFDHFFKVLKIAAMGSGALSVILQGDTAKLLYPLMECLKQFGIEGPNGLLRVYYLGCSYQLERILNMNLESAHHSLGDPGVLCETCPLDILDYAGKYSGPAQWLYSAVLPQPHHEEDWTRLQRQRSLSGLKDIYRWYLSRIISRQGWRLLFSMVQSTILPNGVSCPAFALVCRENENDKQALLVIRGTQTSIDWSINLDETLYSFAYRSGPKGETLVQGFTHTGMMLGALHILDVYGMRSCLHSLIDNRYDVKIVGHSLGAGTSTLLAAELRNGLYARAATQGSSARPLSDEIPRVCAIGYGCPPVVCETIADALLSDDLMLTVIHRDDIVPRLCRYNLEALAREVTDITPQAEKWKSEDQASFKRYATTYGVVGDMTANNEMRAEDSLIEEPSPAIPPSTEQDSTDNVNNFEISVPKEMSALIVEKQTMQFVVPGKIIHLSMANGFYHGVLCDHRLTSLRSITPLTHGIEDHKMANHIKALRTLKNKYRPIQACEPPPWQNFYDPNTKQWEKCSVCNSEVTWPYITKGEPTRAVVSHHCRACGQVVCTLCAPKSDLVPTEGVGKYQTLSDISISLPSLGYVEPERVCLPCYLHSYDL